MPRIFRGMKEKDGFPMIGSGGTSLGVRLPDPTHPEIRSDIVPDVDGTVAPGQGGMSVSPDIASLPPHAVPKRLKALYRDAMGSDKMCVWSMGEGAFVNGALSEDLLLRVDPSKAHHGFVEPGARVEVQTYVEAIHSTREQWIDIETRPYDHKVR